MCFPVSGQMEVALKRLSACQICLVSNQWLLNDLFQLYTFPLCQVDVLSSYTGLTGWHQSPFLIAHDGLHDCKWHVEVRSDEFLQGGMSAFMHVHLHIVDQ